MVIVPCSKQWTIWWHVSANSCQQEMVLLKDWKKESISSSGEPPLQPKTKSKCHIPKVMFLCAVARPPFDNNRHSWFASQIGLWPFVEKKPAIRNSVNCPRGTIKTKNTPSVNSDEYIKMMLEKVLPAIKQKWPQNYRKNDIIIQEDNAKPHHKDTRKAIVEVAWADGWDVIVNPQLPKSPDLNVNNLGFFKFRSIATAQGISWIYWWPHCNCTEVLLQ